MIEYLYQVLLEVWRCASSNIKKKNLKKHFMGANLTFILGFCLLLKRIMSDACGLFTFKITMQALGNRWQSQMKIGQKHKFPISLPKARIEQSKATLFLNFEVA